MKKSIIFGGLFGLIAPFIGVFAGLQVSVMLGNVLAFPLILVSMVTGTPIGGMSWMLLILGLVLSIVEWAIIFFVVASLLGKKREQPTLSA